MIMHVAIASLWNTMPVFDLNMSFATLKFKLEFLTTLLRSF